MTDRILLLWGFIMDVDMSEVNERLARVEQGQVHQEKQLDKLVSVTEKLADVHIRMSSLEGKVEKHETKISQNEKQIAKYSLLFAILVGFLVRYFPELKAIVGL